MLKLDFELGKCPIARFIARRVSQQYNLTLVIICCFSHFLKAFLKSGHLTRDSVPILKLCDLFCPSPSMKVNKKPQTQNWHGGIRKWVHTSLTYSQVLFWGHHMFRSHVNLTLLSHWLGNAIPSIDSPQRIFPQGLPHLQLPSQREWTPTRGPPGHPWSWVSRHWFEWRQ